MPTSSHRFEKQFPLFFRRMFQTFLRTYWGKFDYMAVFLECFHHRHYKIGFGISGIVSIMGWFLLAIGIIALGAIIYYLLTPIFT